MDKHPEASHQYEIRVRGQLGDRLLEAFPELHSRVRGGVTVLVGRLPDQAALHGVLTRIESLGLELLEVRRRSSRLDPPAAAGHSRPRAAETTGRSA